MSVFMGPLAAGVITTIVFVHELGHAYAAWVRGHKADPPIIVSVVLLTLGITRVHGLKNLPDQDRYAIYATGPKAGLFMAFLCLPLVFGFGLRLRVLILSMGSEVYAATLGSDAQAMKRITHATPAQ